MRVPSRQITASADRRRGRLPAATARARSAEHQPFGAVGDAGREEAAGRVRSRSRRRSRRGSHAARHRSSSALGFRGAGVKCLQLGKHGGVVVRRHVFGHRSPRRKARHCGASISCSKSSSPVSSSFSIWASAKRPTIKSISRTPRRQARNRSLPPPQVQSLARSFGHRVHSLRMILSENRHPLFRDHDVNAKSPDGPGVGYIEGDADDVRTSRNYDVGSWRHEI